VVITAMMSNNAMKPTLRFEIITSFHLSSLGAEEDERAWAKNLTWIER